MSTPQTCHRLILASQSPRRRELLAQTGLEFTVLPSGIDESRILSDNPESLVAALSSAKAHDIASQNPDAWVLGSDTIVVVDDIVLGKPEDKNAAIGMLRQMSGRTHQVLTGVALCHETSQAEKVFVVQTDVVFKPLSEPEIQWYVTTPEPYDKAGGYAIQGLAAQFVMAISGSYTNVVGLPLFETVSALEELGIMAWPPAALSE